jgi:hypothetical protein
VVRPAPLKPLQATVRFDDAQQPKFARLPGVTPMSFLTHAAFSIMMLLALWAGIWSHERAAE